MIHFGKENLVVRENFTTNKSVNFFSISSNLYTSKKIDLTWFTDISILTYTFEKLELV
jgi:hypothetical protein